MNNNQRLYLIDSIRGITILSMIGFHACWILNFFGIAITDELLAGRDFSIWERSICCTFIFISGFVFNLSRHRLKNGIIVLSLGVLITIGSLLLFYEVRDIFGVLWVLGISPILTIPIDKYVMHYNKKKVILLLTITVILLVLTWNINVGYIGIGELVKIELPRSLYKGMFMTFLGFMETGFYSVDYFSFMPWYFLYLAGYFAYKLIKNTRFERKILTKNVPVLSTIGRHSLLIYLAHPVILFVLIYMLA